MVGCPGDPHPSLDLCFHPARKNGVAGRAVSQGPGRVGFRPSVTHSHVGNMELGQEERFFLFPPGALDMAGRA